MKIVNGIDPVRRLRRPYASTVYKIVSASTAKDIITFSAVYPIVAVS
jgi:hypothetical protein